MAALNYATRYQRISIHAPLAGCDERRDALRLEYRHFNPRTPCGVRRTAKAVPAKEADFNPRTPCGVRPAPPLSASEGRHFNPRTPCGVRRSRFRASTAS